METNISTSLGHSILTPVQPVPKLTLKCQVPDRGATGVPIFSHWYDSTRKNPHATSGNRIDIINPGAPALEADLKLIEIDSCATFCHWVHFGTRVLHQLLVVLAAKLDFRMQTFQEVGGAHFVPDLCCHVISTKIQRANFVSLDRQSVILRIRSLHYFFAREVRIGFRNCRFNHGAIKAGSLGESTSAAGVMEADHR